MKLETVKEKGSPRYVNRDTLEVATSNEIYNLVADSSISVQDVIASAIAGVYNLDYTEKYIILNLIRHNGCLNITALKEMVAKETKCCTETVRIAIKVLCKMNLLVYKSNFDVVLGSGIALGNEDMNKVKYVTIKVGTNCDSNKVNV